MNKMWSADNLHGMTRKHALPYIQTHEGIIDELMYKNLKHEFTYISDLKRDWTRIVFTQTCLTLRKMVILTRDTRAIKISTIN